MYQLRRLVLVGSPSERRQLILSYLQARSCNYCNLLFATTLTPFGDLLYGACCTRHVVCGPAAWFATGVYALSVPMHTQAVADALVAKFVDADHVPTAEGNAGARWRIRELDDELQ